MNLFAYIDPGTGSMIVQALIGVFAGVMFFSKSLIRQGIARARLFFSKPKNTSTEE